MTVPLSLRLARLGEVVRAAPAVTVEGDARTILFVSHGDGDRRAEVFTVAGEDAALAWFEAAGRLATRGRGSRWLRVDWVIAADRTDWRSLRARLARTKRNYFRQGIALDAGFERAFLEVELNANAMLYPGPRVPHAAVNEKNFTLYAQARHGPAAVDFGDDTTVWTFVTAGVFMDVDGTAHPLGAPGRDSGRRRVEPLDPAAIERVVRAGSDYLARQVQPDGRFTYGWHPCFDRAIPAYNNLRHASSTYAMIEAWEVTRDPALRDAIERALGHLVDRLIRPARLPDGRAAAFLVDVGEEIKLGGNAVSLLALVKYGEVTGDDRFRALAGRLGEGILHMQDAATGRFVHVLHAGSLEVKQAFRIIYYDGEAAFALMRLHASTGEPRWLAAVERAFGHFIAAGHARAHDHWLGYAADELTRVRPDDAYFGFGIDNVRDHLDFVIERITTFPTLLELMTAAERMVRRLRADPARAHLLDRLDLTKFHRALHVRAHYLLNGHFWPELAMFFANPARIAGGFFIRHHAFRVRIDDVEHYLSGLIAYRRHLLDRPDAVPPPTGWTAAEVALATGGRWTAPPPEGWRAEGLCIAARTFRAGDMAVVGEPGIPAGRIAALAPAAVVTTRPDAAAGVPVLAVEDTGAAILSLGRHARARMQGKVVGVTGSAGKTTMVAMLAALLGEWGEAGATRANANLPHGVAWNLASVPWDTPHIVLELAIGRMAQSTRLARPDVALFTNILPAHLEFHGDLATIARRKSAIFQGMAPGGIAVLNRDMAEWATVHAAARARGLRVVHYGRGSDAAFRLLDYDPQRCLVHAAGPDGAFDFALGAPGEHMALNALAALAVAYALRLDYRQALCRLAVFVPLKGRGARSAIDIDGRRVTIIDDAYNANPGSMAAAFRLLDGQPARRRVAVLGEMLELGPDAARYHDELAPLAEACGVDRVHVVGGLYDGFWNALPADRRGVRAASVDALGARLNDSLEHGDVVLFKGSHGSGIHRLATGLVRRYRGRAPVDKGVGQR